MTDQPQTAPCTAYIENAHSYGRQHCVRPAEHTDSDAWPRPDHASPLIADAGIAGTAGRIYWDDTHVGAVPHLAAPDSTAVREQLLHALDFAYCQTLGYGSPEELLAAYDASRTATDPAAPDVPAAPRETAAAVLAVVETALGDTLVPAARVEALAGITAVLPATTNHDTDTGGFELRGDTEIRAAALREAIALLDQRASSIDAFSSSDFGEEARAVRELTDVANELRRMADETAATETQARRGDPFEAWLKAQRDDHRDADRGQWTVLDNLLDRYRLHADTGTPLDGHVCEARVVGDCECLEQPAAGPRQDGAQQ